MRETSWAEGPLEVRSAAPAWGADTLQVMFTRCLRNLTAAYTAVMVSQSPQDLVPGVSIHAERWVRGRGNAQGGRG